VFFEAGSCCIRNPCPVGVGALTGLFLFNDLVVWFVGKARLLELLAWPGALLALLLVPGSALL